MNKKNSGISIPSWFWEQYFTDTIGDTPQAKRFQKMADRARNHILRTNERIRDIRRDPTSTDGAKSVQIERVTKSAKKEFEEMINGFTAEIASEVSEINAVITKEIKSADKIRAQETRMKLSAMKPSERAAFVRRLEKAGSWERISHILQDDPAFIGIEDDEYQQAKQAYISGQFPDEAERLKVLKTAETNFKRGFFAAVNDFNGFQSSATSRAERAEKAISG